VSVHRFSLEDLQALWRAFCNIGTVSAMFGNESFLSDHDVTQFNQALDDDMDWKPTTWEQTNLNDAAVDPWAPSETGQMFPTDFFSVQKPKPKPRDPDARADRVIESLLQDPVLAVLVRNKLGAKKVAKPWKKNHADIWAREVHGEDATAAYMKNDGAPNNGGDGRPNWRLMAPSEEGAHNAVDTTDDVQAGRDAIDIFLYNTGWILL
jgi:hypothetical protein